MRSELVISSSPFECQLLPHNILAIANRLQDIRNWSSS
jgi:hypothetical protein